MRLVILHYHIFKNAGTTIEDILDHSFGERFLPLDVPGLDKPVSNAELLEHIECRPDLSALSSHQIRHPVPRVAGYLFFDCCFLRDPLDRLRSTYDYYRQKPDPSDPRSALASRTGLGEFLAAMIREFPLYVKNVQVNLLACQGDSDEPTEADLRLATERMLETSFLGVVDQFDESAVAGEYRMRQVFPELDCARPAANVSKGMEKSLADRTAEMREACGEEVFQELLRLNQLDLRLLELARVEVERRFQAVPDHEFRLKELAKRRVKSALPQVVPAPAAPPGVPVEYPALGTSIGRAIALLPYLGALGRARKTLFDEAAYRKRCPEAGTGDFEVWLHFLLAGGFAGVNPHPLFDVAFYLRKNPDVAASSVNPLAHYVKCGAKEGRQPHPLFDPAFYLSKYPDVAAAGQNPLLHYIRHGAAEDRKPHPMFDPAHYRKTARLAINKGNLLGHFLARGRDAASPHPLFDCDAWRAEHPESTGNPLVEYLAQPRERKRRRQMALSIGDVEATGEAEQLPFLQALQEGQLREMPEAPNS